MADRCAVCENQDEDLYTQLDWPLMCMECMGKVKDCMGQNIPGMTVRDAIVYLRNALGFRD